MTLSLQILIQTGYLPTANHVTTTQTHTVHPISFPFSVPNMVKC